MFIGGFGERGYLELLEDILKNGVENRDRTGIGTKKVFGKTLNFDLSESFPILTTKRVPLRLIVSELLWMISGSTNIRPLVLEGNHIWNEWPLKHYLQTQGRLEEVGINTPAWREEMNSFVENIRNSPEFATEWGELGPVYGYQWRHWKTPNGEEIDQLQKAIDTIKKSPDSRRIMVTAWNPSDIEEMAISGLPPCHYGYQFQVMSGKLNCLMTQRSVDSFLGLPFNIASYALLTYLVADLCKLQPGELILSLGDTHIYLNHLDQVKMQLERFPYPFPQLYVNPRNSIDDYIKEDIALVGYQCHPAIKGEIAV